MHFLGLIIIIINYNKNRIMLANTYKTFTLHPELSEPLCKLIYALYTLYFRPGTILFYLYKSLPVGEIGNWYFQSTCYVSGAVCAFFH